MPVKNLHNNTVVIERQVSDSFMYEYPIPKGVTLNPKEWRVATERVVGSNVKFQLLWVVGGKSTLIDQVYTAHATYQRDLSNLTPFQNGKVQVKVDVQYAPHQKKVQRQVWVMLKGLTVS